jgi:hypothetical protein
VRKAKRKPDREGGRLSSVMRMSDAVTPSLTVGLPPLMR